MPAMTPAQKLPKNTGRLAATVLLAALPLLTTSSISIATETDGEWKCAQAPETGKWSCSRDGVAASDLAGPATTDAASAATQIAADVTAPAPVESNAAQPAEIDPYEARARAAQERIDHEVAEPEPAVDMPAESTSTELVDEPVAAASEPVAPPPAPEPVQLPDPEPVADPVVAEAPPVDTANLPAYQALAYVPDKPTSLLELPPNFWVAQLMAVSSKEFLESYAEEHNLRGLSAARIASGEKLFYVLILGIYETKDKAEAAITNMPPRTPSTGLCCVPLAHYKTQCVKRIKKPAALTSDRVTVT